MASTFWLGSTGATGACAAGEPVMSEATSGALSESSTGASAERPGESDGAAPESSEGSAPEPSDDTGSAPESSSSGGDDSSSTGEPGDGLVPVFVAQGSMGRTTMSCDDGLSWIHDRAYDTEGAPEVCGLAEPVACWESPCSRWNVNTGVCEPQDTCDCDHSPAADMGIAFGHGRFATTWGWGPPGAIKTSTDGTLWSTVVADTTFAGIAFGHDTFVALARTPMLSRDGEAWVEGNLVDFRDEAGEVIWNARNLGYVDAGGGVFVAGASSGDRQDLMVSHDQGNSWTRPEGGWVCGGSFIAVAGHDDDIVVLFGDRACRSADGGVTFELVELAGGRGLVFDGEQFVAWTYTDRWTSLDGAIWQPTTLVVQGMPEGHAFQPGPIVRSDATGTYVSVRNAWMQWYDAQDFYRSEDGVTWQVLPAGSFTPSHRIRRIVHGRVDPSACW